MLPFRGVSDWTLPFNPFHDPSTILGPVADEHLEKVQLTFNQSNQPLSPPAKNTFDFPSLLECLSDQPKGATMPFQGISLSDESHSDIERSIEVESPKEPPVLAQPKAKKVDDQSTYTSRSSLRERTARQCMPYTMYSTQKKFDAKGMRLSEAELEEIVSGQAECNATKGKASKKRKRKRKRSHTSTLGSDTERASSTFPRLPSVLETTLSVEEILANTTIRTRFSGFDRATIPLIAKTCPSHEQLFVAIQKKWAFKLNGRNPQYCVAEFPWLGQDKNILLQLNDTEGFDSVMEEIKRAPDWREGRKVEVVIEIFAD